MTTDSNADFSQNKSSFFARGAFVLILLLTAIYAWRPIGPGYDFWAHAAVGRWICANGEVPRHTLFLWSIEPPYPWVAHSWLFEIVSYGLLALGNRLAGDDANGIAGAFCVVAVMTLLTLAVFALLWKLWQCRAPDSFVAPLFFAVAIWAAAPRFQPRPEVFTALFFTVLLLALIWWRALRSQKTSLIWLLVPMFALWANFHGAVLMGVLMLGLAALGDALQYRDARSRQLILVWILCVAATLVNPFGFAYWRDVVSSSSSQMFTLIGEWQSPLLAREMWPYVAVELALASVALTAWWRNPQRRWSELLWLFVMSVLMLKQRRHFWLLAIVVLVVAGSNARYLSTRNAWNWWRKISRQTPEPPSPAMRALARGGVLFCLAFGACVAALTKSDELFPLRGISPTVPEAAVRFLEKANPPGNLFNDYENSSYLQWRLNGPLPDGRVLARGKTPLYIDLLNAYEDGPRGLMVEYLDVVNHAKTAERVFAQREIRTIILGAHEADSALARHLNQNSPQWRRAFHDRNATVWVRRK